MNRLATRLRSQSHRITHSDRHVWVNSPCGKAARSLTLHATESSQAYLPARGSRGLVQFSKAKRVFKKMCPENFKPTQRNGRDSRFSKLQSNTTQPNIIPRQQSMLPYNYGKN